MTSSNQHTVNPKNVEKLLTVKQAADALNLPYRQLLSAVQSMEIPSYQVLKSRRLVFASEILASIRSIKQVET